MRSSVSKYWRKISNYFHICFIFFFNKDSTLLYYRHSEKVTFYCHQVVKFIATFLYMIDPTLRPKMTATNLAFWWFRLLIIVLWFSLRKFIVCPVKVAIISFFGCSELQWTKFTCILFIELKSYWPKLQVFWNAVIVGFLMVRLNETVLHKKWCNVGLCKIVVRAVGFWGNFFGWKVSLFTLKCLSLLILH